MRKIRVMIVEDSAAVREFLQHVIGADLRLEVVAAVDSAEKALRMLEPLSPDVISMDVHLPGMDGLAATREIMQRKPTPIVIVSGSVDPGDQKNSMLALRAGALAVVNRPVGALLGAQESTAEDLCTQLALMSQVSVIRQRFNGQRRAVPRSQMPLFGGLAEDGQEAVSRFSVLGLVASTGGPAALQAILPSLGPRFPLPIVLVQHIMASFHKGFVDWLSDICSLPVHTVSGFRRLEPGRIYVAPADRHLEVRPGAVSVRTGEAVCRERPSGTVLFQSMASSFGSRALAVLLTGMGEDGAAGLEEIRDAGGYTIAEDESTAVVYGMPAAAVRRRAVCESIPLHEIAPRLRELVGERQPSSPLDAMAERTL